MIVTQCPLPDLEALVALVTSISLWYLACTGLLQTLDAFVTQIARCARPWGRQARIWMWTCRRWNWHRCRGGCRWPRGEWICINASQSTEALHELERFCMTLRAVLLHHGMRFWKFVFIFWKTVLKAADALLFSWPRLLVAPIAATEALSRNSGTFEQLAALGFWHRQRIDAGYSQSLAYTWIVTDARRLNRP